MSKLSKNDDFHISFIQNLAFVGLVTVVSMITTHFLVINYLPKLIQTQEYTTQQSQIQPD
jgi:uncharacterized membrane protein